MTGEVKNSIGNGEAKELICMTHGHELRAGMLVGGGCMAEEDKGRKKWDNCDSIINKICLEEKKRKAPLSHNTFFMSGPISNSNFYSF